MSTRNNAQEWAEQNSPFARGVLQSIRRMAVSLSSGPLWQVIGHLMPDGRKEARQAEAFTGIGFYARPKADNRAESIVLFPGGAPNPVVVATRDEDSRKAIAGDLDEDETSVHNSQVSMRVKASGTIEIGAGPTVERTLMGETYRGAEDTLFAALKVFVAAISAHSAPLGPYPDPALVTACTTMTAAITAFDSAGGDYLTAIARVR